MEKHANNSHLLPSHTACGEHWAKMYRNYTLALS